MNNSSEESYERNFEARLAYAARIGALRGHVCFAIDALKDAKVKHWVATEVMRVLREGLAADELAATGVPVREALSMVRKAGPGENPARPLAEGKQTDQ